MIEKKLLIALKNDDKSALKSIYIEYKLPFLNFAKKFNISEDDSLDIYQDAIVSLRENCMKGHLDDMKSELKTYLFSIGKYMIYKRLKEKHKLHLVDRVVETSDLNDDYFNEIDYSFNSKQKQIQEAFKKLGKQCQTILNLFYVRGFTLEEIVDELNYNNYNVAKSQKSRCLQKIKDIILNSK